MIVKKYKQEAFQKGYTERPHTLVNVTLADWAAWYDVCKKPNKQKICQHDTHTLLQEN